MADRPLTPEEEAMQIQIAMRQQLANPSPLDRMTAWLYGEDPELDTRSVMDRILGRESPQRLGPPQSLNKKPATMRPATQKERYESHLNENAGIDAVPVQDSLFYQDAARRQRQARGAPTTAPATSMRPSTWSERLGDTTVDFGEAVKDNPLTQTLQLGYGLAGGGPAREAGQPEQFSEMFQYGVMPDVPGKDAGAKLATAATEDLARSLFPRLDKYGKPAGLLSGKTILKRLETAPGVTPETRTALAELAEKVGTRRVSADEIHALARGETYKPKRIIRKVKAPAEGTKQLPGAPYGVTNARQARGLRENYIKSMEKGVKGRDWYTDAGESILFHANDDPIRANLLAEDLAVTSSTTGVGGNTGFGVKGYNQATAGTPVVTGRFPAAMGKRIAEIHEGGAQGGLGLKRTPFAQNLARGGGFQLRDDPSRAVHDIWDAEAHGYMNPDGSPMRVGFGPAQHRFMDTQQDKIIDAANQRASGGFTDWDDLTSQASTWTGQKIDAGQVSPEDAAKSYADYMADLYAQGSRETVPGATTGHMPELLKPDAAQERQLLHEMMTRESGIYDAQGRDQITAGYGGLVGRGFEGPGAFQGATSPGWQTQVLTGSLEAPGGPSGARVLDEGSRRILDASEATHGLLMGQDASAYSRILPAGSGAPRTGWDVALPGGTVDPEQMQALIKRLGAGANDAVLVPTPDGVRLAQMDEGTMKALVKELGGKVKSAGTLQGNYLPNNWQAQRVGQDYLEPIQKMGTEKFDAFAPAMAERLRGVDARFAKETKGRFTLSPVMDEVRATIAGEGFKGLERLAKKYAIPVTLLVASLGELGESVPQSDSAP